MKTTVIGSFRIRVRPDAPNSFQVTGPRLPGEPKRTRRSFSSLDEARKMATQWDAACRDAKQGRATGSVAMRRKGAHQAVQAGPVEGPATSRMDAAGGAGAVQIVVNLPPLTPGCEMVVTVESPNVVRVRVDPVLGYTLDEACERIPSRPHRDTLRAQLESSGVQVGAIGRTPLVSIQQLQQALKLGA